MKITITLLFILVFSFTVLGQDIEATTKDGKKVILKSDKTWDYVVDSPKKEAAINSTVNFSIDNIEEVKNFTNSISKEIQKSEFETESEYNTRLSKLIEEKQFNNKSIKNLAFLVKPELFTYSAEEQSFSLYLFGDSQLRFVDWQYSGFVPITIQRNLPMPSEKAKDSKALLEIIILGFPVETSIIGLKVVPTQIVIRNKKSGEIYLNEKVGNFVNIQNRIDRVEIPDSPRLPSNSVTPSSTKPVQVDGYYRRDGTYVRPHTRNRPSKKP